MKKILSIAEANIPHSLAALADCTWPSSSFLAACSKKPKLASQLHYKLKIFTFWYPIKSTLPSQPVSAFLMKGGRGLVQPALDILITKTDSTNPTVTSSRHEPKYKTATTELICSAIYQNQLNWSYQSRVGCKRWPAICCWWRKGWCWQSERSPNSLRFFRRRSLARGMWPRKGWSQLKFTINCIGPFSVQGKRIATQAAWVT